MSYFDYRQIEPRLLAYFLARIGDTKLADYLNSGIDPYTAILGEFYGRDDFTEQERQDGKILFLSLQYGGGVRTIKRQLDVDYHGAKRLINRFHEAWPGVRRLQDLCAQTAQSRGYIKTPWGRHLHPEENGEHKLLNKLVQGSAADVMKAALIQVDKFIHPDSEYNRPYIYRLNERRTAYEGRAVQSQMVSVVHDEIQFDGPTDELWMLHESVPRLMCEADPTTAEIAAVVPILVDHEVTFSNWAEKESYESWLERQTLPGQPDSLKEKAA